ncbi:MAG: RNA methyltransferase [Ignavibacteriales bacterium]|nr:RNA methyltransferase [Ignavibacteriales bacterium]
MHLSKNEIKHLHSLSQKKVRHAEKKFILEGWRALKEALNSSFQIELVAVLPQYLENQDYAKTISEIGERKIPLKELTELELKKIADTVHSQGVIALTHQKPFSLNDNALKQSSLVVAVDSVSDPGNLGSILRSADWFGVDAVLLGKGCVELYNEKVVRSTVGSIFHLTIIEGVDLQLALPEAQKNDFWVMAASGDGKEPYTLAKTKPKNVLVFGNEAHGVTKEIRTIADAVIKIPKFGRAESLNVGVACGILLAHLREKTQMRNRD